MGGVFSVSFLVWVFPSVVGFEKIGFLSGDEAGILSGEG